MIQKRPNIPTVLVILGATGDLISRKIVPALFHLYKKNQLPKMLHVIGFSRRDLQDFEFQAMIRDMIGEHPDMTIEQIDQFTRLFTYQKGNFDNKADYVALGKILGAIDGKWRTCSNKLFYLAVPPQYYDGIFRNLSETGLTDPCSPEEGWTRVLVEKPFGKDLNTSQKLDELLATFFKEEQIYRIDHYLAKEMLQNILSFRFANSMFEEGWNNKFIERIDIKLWETLGVEKRGAFYDGVGALRDVGQNHLLQMLALVTMNHPKNFGSDSIRKSRTALLKAVQPPAEDEIKQETYRAQYEGYQAIDGVSPHSQTETYFKVNLHLENDRWEGVPVSIEGGKRIGTVQKEICITYKHTAPCLCPEDQPHLQNKIIFRMEPEENITLSFVSKKPKLDFEVEEKDFTVSLREKIKGNQYVEEYEKLLLDAIRGDQTLFVSTEEVKEMWRVIDPIILAWQNNAVPLSTYRPDTTEAVLEAAQKMSKPLTTLKKEIGIIGLGKMGGNLARRLVKKGWTVYGYNRSPEVTKQLETEGVHGTYSVKELVDSLSGPKLIWLMLPAGKPTDDMLFGEGGLASVLQKGDFIVEGANSFFEDTISRYKKIEKSGIHFIDAGVSGGPGGALNGASIMVGGQKEVYKKLRPLFEDLSVANGVSFFEGAGAGHFIKMVHNGIEYGMMQAIAEGFAVMKKSDYQLDLKQIAHIYNNGTVIESRLMQWLKQAFESRGSQLEGVSGKVAQNGEGAWTVEVAKKLGVSVPVIEDSVQFRIDSQETPSFTGKILSALREQFGGHAVGEK
ncbi:glucose-6-phosphate dehydrogenase [Candidatus Roizmanbacteria bacterium]|nr:glucose-6-phosphate dehydrogenase [Candidatus Roizmanbacteria bacterium]